MSHLQIIEMLCALTEEQAHVIRYLSMELAHARNLTEAEAQMIENTNHQYAKILGTNETPDIK